MNFIIKNGVMFSMMLVICGFSPLVQGQKKSDFNVKDDRKGAAKHNANQFSTFGHIPIAINARENAIKFVKQNIPQSKNNARGASNFIFKQRGPFNVSGRIRAIGTDSRDEKIIMVGSASGGVYRSADSGGSWTQVSKPNDNPSVTGLAQDPFTPDTWYYITGEVSETVNTNQSDGDSPNSEKQFFPGSGVYKSVDNGLTWSLLTATKPQANDPDKIVVVPEEVGTTSGWQFCTDIAIDPTNGDVYVTNVNGIQRSTDKGVTWTTVLAGKADYTFEEHSHIDLYVDPTSNNKLFYATIGGDKDTSGLFRSTDGTTWTKLTTIPNALLDLQRIEVAINPTDSDIVWFLGAVQNKLFKYKHSTESWTDRSANLPALGGNVGDFNTQGNYNLVLKVNPTDGNTIYVGGTSLYRSTDEWATKLVADNTGNTQWIAGYAPDNSIDQYPNSHADIHFLYFFPGSSTKVLNGHDGGISMSTNIKEDNSTVDPDNQPIRNPVTWINLNKGLYTTQAFAVAIEEKTANENTIVVGYQDNGSWTTNSTDNKQAWIEEGSGDGAWNAVSNGGNTRYTSSQNGSVLRTTGTVGDFINATFINVNPPNTGKESTNAFISPFILDQNDSKIMYYVAKKDLWVNKNIEAESEAMVSSSWNQLNLSTITFKSDEIISALETSTSPANMLYLGTSYGQVIKITNANGANPAVETISTGKGLSDGFINSLEVDPVDANKVYITFANYGLKSIFMTNNGGTSWTNISGNLEENADGTGNGPALRWFHVFKKPDGSDIYFAGASTGLYATETLNGEMTSWEQYGVNEIGYVPVSMIKSRKVDSYIVVTTHGKGTFSANFSEDNLEVTSFSPNNGVTNIPFNAALTLTFGKNVVIGNEVNITLKEFDTDMEVGSLKPTDNSSVTFTDNKITITLPSGALKANTKYYVILEQGFAKDAAGNLSNAITDKTQWTFTTGAGEDKDVPTVTIYSPTNGMTDVAVDINLTITFNEDILKGSGNILIKEKDNDQLLESIAVSGTNVTIDNKVVTINPMNNFLRDLDYYVTIDDTAFKDIAGNAFLGVSDKTTWAFKTTSSSADQPSLISISPTIPSTTPVELDQSFVFTFDRNMKKGTGVITIKNFDSDAVFESIDITSAAVSIAGTNVSIDPTKTFAEKTKYYFEIPATTLLDEKDQPFSGSMSKEVNFTTKGKVNTVSVIRDEVSEKMTVASIVGGVRLEFPKRKLGKFTMNIFDIHGRKVHKEIRSYAREKVKNLRTQKMEPGIYIVMVKTEDDRVFKTKIAL